MTDRDPRYSLANERTMLAWNRTALGLISAGAAAVAFLDDLGDARLLVAVPLIVVGAVVAVLSYRRWQAIEAAIRDDAPLPPSRLPQVLEVAVALIGVATAVVAVIEVVD